MKLTNQYSIKKKYDHKKHEEIKQKLKDYFKRMRDETISIQHRLMKNGEQRGYDKAKQDFESRTCENCMHNKEQDNFMIFCDCAMCLDGSRMMWHSYTKDFCCNKWEKKDER